MARYKSKLKREEIEERSIVAAKYMLEHRTTVRKVAAKLGVCKSTVFTDLTVVLPKVDAHLYQEVRKILDFNRNERYYRGGLATKKVYAEKLVSAIAAQYREVV